MTGDNTALRDPFCIASQVFIIATEIELLPETCHKYFVAKVASSNDPAINLMGSLSMALATMSGRI